MSAVDLFWPVPKQDHHNNNHNNNAEDPCDLVRRHFIAHHFGFGAKKFGSCVLTTYRTTQLLAHQLGAQLLGPPHFWLKGNSKGNNQSMWLSWHEVVDRWLKQALQNKILEVPK